MGGDEAPTVLGSRGSSREHRVEEMGTGGGEGMGLWQGEGTGSRRFRPVQTLK